MYLYLITVYKANICLLFMVKFILVMINKNLIFFLTPDHVSFGFLPNYVKVLVVRNITDINLNNFNKQLKKIISYNCKKK